MDIGISRQDCDLVAKELKAVLADSYTLYLQTHNFHWNVTGPHFIELHQLFEDHYTNLAMAVDEIAERIRTLGVASPGTYKAFAELSTIEEVEGVPNANEMLEILSANHDKVLASCRKALKIAQSVDDESTVSLLSERMSWHEKTAWMLNSMLA